MPNREELRELAVIEWAYAMYCEGNVFWAADRQKKGYPIVAELSITKNDLKMFPLLVNVRSIIMYPKDETLWDTRPINKMDENGDFEPLPIEEIKFELEDFSKRSAKSNCKF